MAQRGRGDRQHDERFKKGSAARYLRHQSVRSSRPFGRRRSGVSPTTHLAARRSGQTLRSPRRVSPRADGGGLLSEELVPQRTGLFHPRHGHGTGHVDAGHGQGGPRVVVGDLRLDGHRTGSMHLCHRAPLHHHAAPAGGKSLRHHHFHRSERGSDLAGDRVDDASPLCPRNCTDSGNLVDHSRPAL